MTDRRTSIIIDEDINRKVQKIRTDIITKTSENCSYSRVVNALLKFSFDESASPEEILEIIKKRGKN